MNKFEKSINVLDERIQITITDLDYGGIHPSIMRNQIAIMEALKKILEVFSDKEKAKAEDIKNLGATGPG